MEWVVAQHSKKEVARAGNTLIDAQADDQQRLAAMEVLSNWRAAHAYPMHAVLISLRNVVKKIDTTAIVAQRLKRTPSIVGKLQRFQNMSLSRMQDIAGCRAVVKNARTVRLLSSTMIESRTRNRLHKKDDYIAEPKDSGYRGIHLVYKYNGEKKEYSDYFVEIQLRSKIQHAWATAVEIVDTFTKQALKASNGKTDWLDFFKYVSVEFAKIEKCPLHPIANAVDTKSEVIRLANKLKVANVLNAFAVSTRHLTKSTIKNNSYFLLELSEHATKIFVTSFSANQLEQATKIYLQKEEQAKIDDSYDVVLVAANSVNSLKKAYPNYFADSKDFLKLLNSVTLTGVV
jgi:ppGpp synthetase/RelA/SpoT-type nucleotidyltranferase